jgi:hypothetical protein
MNDLVIQLDKTGQDYDNSEYAPLGLSLAMQNEFLHPLTSQSLRRIKVPTGSWPSG